MSHDMSKPTACCTIPMEQALAVIARLEVAARLASQIDEVLERERAQSERLHTALAELVGEEEAAIIAQGEDFRALALVPAGGPQASGSDPLSEALADVLAPLTSVTRVLGA